MTNYKNHIEQWLSEHKSSTVPAWLKRNPEIQKWIIEQTAEYSTKNIMENLYIVLNGKPELCEFGNFRKFNTFDLGYRAGCVLGNKCQCVAKKRKQKQISTLIQKYGVESVSKIPGIVERRRATNLKKWGVEWPAQSDSIKQKQLTSFLSRTLEEKILSAEKATATNLQKYGTIHHMKLAQQKQKVSATNVERYGADSPLQNLEIAKKARDTWNNKTQDEIKKIVENRREIFLKKYGVKSASRILVPKSSLEILDSNECFIDFVKGKTRLEVINLLKISPHTLYLYSKKYQAADLFLKPQSSQFELEVYQYLKTFISDDIETNNRNLISPREIDIYIPSKKIAIECNGLYWHGEISADRSRGYHYKKFKECEKQGIKLLTIFEDEWRENNEKVKHRLLHIFNKTTDKIYAKNCNIIDVTTQEEIEFLDNYHLQGYATSQIKFALSYKNEIVAMMTFSKPRFNKKYEYEIIRFCTRVPVTGAATRLFKHFIKKYNPLSVISYSNNRWGTGEIYKIMGFTKRKETIGYYYTNYKNRFDRNHFQKHKLVEQGNDPNLSEWEIAQSLGYDRIWDCGQSLWVYDKT